MENPQGIRECNIHGLAWHVSQQMSTQETGAHETSSHAHSAAKFSVKDGSGEDLPDSGYSGLLYQGLRFGVEGCSLAI